jgi:molecular chaperone HtpG
MVFFVDPIDAFLTPVLTDYRDQVFVNIDDASLDLPQHSSSESDNIDENILSEVDLNRFIGRCVTIMGDKVAEVRISDYLRNSPVRLVSPEAGPERDMQRISRYLGHEYELPRKILEVNGRHLLIVNLARMVADDPANPLIDLSINQLFDSALLFDGLLPSPSSMLPRIQQLMELATQAGENNES